MMLCRSIDHLFSGKKITWSHTNLSEKEISPYLYSAVISGEDQRFFQHHGFDETEIEQAMRAHARHPNRPERGASTISQQVAKNLFLPPWHSFIRKGVEAYYTVLMELMWPKQRILQMYANIAEFAPGVYGAERPARSFTSSITPDSSPSSKPHKWLQCCRTPERWSASHPSPYIQRRAARILRQMRGIPTDEDEDGEPD